MMGSRVAAAALRGQVAAGVRAWQRCGVVWV